MSPDVVAPGDVLAGPSPYQFAILMGLTRTGRHVYGGTVPAHVKASRRAANRAASKARRAHRKAAR